MVKDYQAWSFWDRSFAAAAGISILWHLFWFFSVKIVVGPAGRAAKERPRIVSLGPVLDDAFFRTLVENKPQLSETFYRRWSDFTPSLEPEVKTMERYAPGGVVSVPFRERFLDSLRTLVGGDKVTPEEELSSKLRLGYREEIHRIEGEVRKRPVLNRPSEPQVPPGVDPSLAYREVELQFTVDPEGSVVEVETLLSSGSSEIDWLWVHYLKQWRFSPLKWGPPLSQKGKARFRFQKK